MKKIDVINLNTVLNSEEINKITDMKISYPLFELSKDIEVKIQTYVEFVKKQKDPKKAETELLNQDETDIDIKKYKSIEKFVFKDKKLELCLRDLKIFDRFFHY